MLCLRKLFVSHSCAILVIGCSGHDTNNDAGAGGLSASSGGAAGAGGGAGSGAPTSGGTASLPSGGKSSANGGTSPASGGTSPASGGNSASGSGGVANVAGASAAGAGQSQSGGQSARGGASSTAGSTSRGGASAAQGGNAGSAAASGSSGNSSAGDVVATIHNGGFWNDASGSRIEAHGGGFLLVSGTWYWVGEDKSQNSGNFKAVNLYSSPDLEHWQFRKAIITKNTTSTLNTADRIIERPKIIYNEKTQKYVMWLHWEGANYADAAAGVFSSSTIDGDYTFVRSFRPNANMSRDCNLFKDDDGKAYFVSAANENRDLMLYDLTDDYLDIKSQLVKLFEGSSREAPAIMKQGGRYFLVTSAATGWDSNQAKYSTATSMAGPWSALTNLGNNTTYDTQSTYLIPVQGTSSTTYVYASDRWQDPDLKGSKYIWLPLKVNGSTLALDWIADWQLNLTKGTWSTNDGFIPQGDWKLVSTDSEETSAEDGHAVNAFDNSASTIWHTKYTGGAPEHPHEIQIDLGASYALTAFNYLPRQDADDHGMVKDYDFYASDDKANYGPTVASGSFNSDRTAKRITFPEKVARYVRFVAKSEINDAAWASIAELDLVGTAR